MAELSLKQITDKLNEEFNCENRKLIFWYDANAEFAEDVDSLELTNAKVYHLEQTNQFRTKCFLEREDTSTSYLIYAPFPKPDIRENHLTDMIRYSKEFFADRVSLLCLDLGIAEQYKPVIQKHIAFFNNKNRTQAFYALGVDQYTADDIETAMMSVLCRCDFASFDEVVRCVLTDGELNDNRYLNEFIKFGLDEAFWHHCDTQFGYTDPEPTPEKLVMCLFATYTQKTVHTDLPAAWLTHASYKPGNVMSFMDNLMNSQIYSGCFDRLSDVMYRTLNAAKVLNDLGPENLTDCCVFAGVDMILIRWMIGRLLTEDTEAKLNGISIPELCTERRKKHFGKKYLNEYLTLENAYRLIVPDLYTPAERLDQIARNYTAKDYMIDQAYRYFYYSYDQLEDNTEFEDLRQLAENIYTNGYLNRIAPLWSRHFVADDGHTRLVNQLDFYNEYIRHRKERLVVIISDAMRYEVGRELFERLQADEKCEAKMTAMQSVLPSITQYGMAALLPHEKITIDEDYNVLCDGNPCGSIKQREAILQKANSESCCVQFDDIRMLKKDDMRTITSGKEVIYVYHNQIDARGDKTASENEVFVACKEAVDELVALIRRITVNGNTTHFVITADHGFIYKRDKLQESDKISGIANAGKRYAISYEKTDTEGTVSVPMNVFDQDGQDERYVIVPAASDLFKTPGSGLNYVHGGCSPQEMIIPVIEVRTEKGKVSVSNAMIDMVTLNNKITNLNITLDFLQTEAVSDMVKAATYRVYFEDANGKRVSNENICHADKTDVDSTKRVFRLKFAFRNQTYARTDKYYLVVVDDKNEMEILRREVVIDIALAGDFGFSI